MGSNLILRDFKEGDYVLYLPPHKHPKGEITAEHIKMGEGGRVRRVNDHYVMVDFDNMCTSVSCWMLWKL